MTITSSHADERSPGVDTQNALYRPRSQEQSSRNDSAQDPLRNLSVLAVDSLLALLSLRLAYAFGLFETNAVSFVTQSLIYLAVLLGFLLISGACHTFTETNYLRQIQRMAVACLISAMITAIPDYILLPQAEQHLPGVGLLSVMSWIFLVAGRLIVSVALTQGSRRFGRTLMIIDSDSTGARSDFVSPQTVNSDFLVMDNVNALKILSRVDSPPVRNVILSLSGSSPDTFKGVIDTVSEYAVNIHVFPEASSMYVNNEVNIVDGLPVITLTRRPLSSLQCAIKRCMDIAVSSALIVLLVPLLILIALAIKLDSKGPVFFRQSRHGYNNQAFQILKFRSMHPTLDSAQTIVQAKRNDNRVTRVGRFLRRTSLDELPQIFNVLKGDMSLIGPRPHAVQHHAQYCDLVHGYRQRHRVKPGITGWAQVNGFRGETDTLDKMSRRINHDLYYIANWSFGFDIKILFMTSVLGFVNRNAY